MNKKRRADRLDRRNFLERAALLALATPLQGCAPRNTPVAATPTAPGSWERIRGEFDLDYSYAHFVGFLIACNPRPVRDEIERYRVMLQRNPALCLEDRETREDEVRAAAASYLGVDKEQIALTTSTTMGLALVYNGIALRPGDEVLTTVHDHHATQQALKFRSDKDGTVIRTIRLFEHPHEASAAEMIAALMKHVNDKTRLVALTWVHSGSGIKLPIAEIGKLLEDVNKTRPAERRIFFSVDGVHGFGVEDTTFDALKCDFFVAGTHKWIFGPRGTGIICSRSRRADALLGTVAHFSSTYDTFGKAMTHGGFHAFEHQWALKKAFEFHLGIGKRAIASRIHALNAYLKERLSEVKRVELVTPKAPELSSGFTFFRVRGADVYKVDEMLWNERISVSPTERDVGPVLRLAPGLLNNEAEIDRTIDVLKRKLG